MSGPSREGGATAASPPGPGAETPGQLRNLVGSRLIANSAQLSIRDLRLRPLRAVPEPASGRLESPLEEALKRYLETWGE